MALMMNEDNVLRSIVRDSFKHFVQEMWEAIIPERLVWNWHMDVICNEMQEMAERIFRNEKKKHDLIINVPPGTTKSTLVSVMFPPWTWTRMPSFRTICGSYAHPLALDLSRKSRDVILSEKYQRLFPHIRLRDDQNTKGYFANVHGGCRYAVGIGGSVTGMHAHCIIPDDPLDPNRAVSEAELKATNAWMSETLPTRKVDKEVSVIVLIMQRLHQDDPTGNRLAKLEAGPIKHICLPATDNGHVQPEELRKYYVDGLLDPRRLPRHVLAQAKAELGEFGYAGQYDQSPVPLGGGMFKVDRLKIDTPPVKFVKIMRYWDKAGTLDAGAYTAGVKIGVELRGKFFHYWVLDVVRGQWESWARENIIRQTAEMDGRVVIIGVEQEPGSSGKEAAENTVRNLAGFRVRIDRPTGDKATRADPFATQVNGNNVSLARGLWNQAYVEEMRFFPFSKYKDQIDASSGAFAYLVHARRVVGVY